MWIDSRYYNRLLNALESFSEGNFDFDEREFNCFRDKKYSRMTEALKDIRDTANNNLENSLKMLDSIIIGTPYTERPHLNFKGSYKIIYDRYCVLLHHFEKLNTNINTISSIITEKGILDSQLDLEDLEGVWLENSQNLNNIIDYFAKNIDEISITLGKIAQGDLTQKLDINSEGKILEVKESINSLVEQSTYLLQNLDVITMILNKVAKGDLTQKITVDAKGEVLALKTTINTMVDELSRFASEVSRVTKEVGIDGKFGAKAELGNASGVWLDLTDNINKMSESLEEFDKENKEQNWIKDGISALSKKILYKDIVEEQFQIAITQLCRYTNVGMGTFYIYDSMTKKLDLEVSYAYEKDENTKTSFNLGEGIIGQVAYDRKPILMEADSSKRVLQSGIIQYQVISTYTSPLIFKGKLIGVVELANCSYFNNLQIEFLENALSVLAGSFYASIQDRDKKKLEYISKTDALTKLNNRGYFEKVLPEILHDAKRTDGLISFAILDIDFFKKFNDQYGHKVGDRVLKSVARVLKDTLKRDEDYCFRIGGEEFSVIFSAYNEEKAFKFMEKIKDRVEEIQIKDDDGNELNNITISVGLVCKRAGEIKDVESLFKEADNLLYQAKDAGRNTIILGK